MTRAEYPPEFDGPDYCEVCGKWIGAGVRTEECACPECAVCTEVGDPDCYTGQKPHMEKGNRAFNIADLAQHLGATRDNASSIAKRLFKDTRCGISFYASRDGAVSIAGFAEGSGDAYCEPIIFQFPIDLDEFDKGVERADQEGCDLFDEYHCRHCGAETHYEDPCNECGRK